MWVAWGGKWKQLLDMETNPGQTLVAHESYTETLVAAEGRSLIKQ